MARNKGTFPFAANFEVKAASPLDPRVLVEKKSELISKDTWPLDGDTLYIYKGLLVSVQEESAIYMLVDPDKILETDYSGWERKDGNQGGTTDGNGSSITVDSFLSESSINPVQNKAIYNELKTKQNTLISGVNIKEINGESILGSGSITIEGLPSAIPDWNENNPSAASYIKNRTHYYNEKLQYRGEIEASTNNVVTYQLSPYEYIDNIVGRAPDKIKFTGGGISFTLDFIKEPIPSYNYEEDRQETVIKRFTIDSNNDIEVSYYQNGDPDYIGGIIIELNLIATDSVYQEYITFATEDYYVDLKQIDDIYIPDTIARKSDLENIGGGGSVDSEEITEIKTTLDSHNELIEDLQNMKIDKENDDYYPNMSVGVADNLSGVDVVASEFTSRQSGGGAILDGTARIEAIKGNSIVWNQKLTAVGKISGSGDVNNSFNVDTNGSHSILTFISDAKVELSGDSSRADYMLGEIVIPEHKYLFCCDIKTLCDAVQVGIGNYNYDRIPVTPGEFCRINAFRTVSSLDDYIYQTAVLYFLANPFDIKAGETIEIKNVAVYDLTQMFGAGNEPTTIDDFYARMPIEINTSLYSKGQMINLNPSGIESYSADEEPIKRFQDLSLIGTLFPDGMKSVGEFHDEIKYNKETQKWEKIVWIGTKAYQDGDEDNAEYFTDGQITYYILEQPIVEVLDEEFGLNNDVNVDFNFDYEVWNGGTEELVADNPSSALKADIAYGFNAVGKIKELENKIDNLGTGGGGNGGSSITVDSVLSDTSTNPVQNKIVTEALSTKLESEVVASSSPTEEIPLGYDDTELRGMVTELSAEVGKKQDTISDLATIREGAEKGATAIQEVKTINGQSIVGSGNIKIQGGGGGNSHWVLRETHTFDGVNDIITISDLPMEFLVLLDYNGAIDKSKKVTFQVGQPEKMRSAYDFAASRQMHIGFHLTSDGVITNIISHSSEWNNTEPTSAKIVYSPIILPQALKLLVYGNSIIPEGTTIKIYTR